MLNKPEIHLFSSIFFFLVQNRGSLKKKKIYTPLLKFTIVRMSLKQPFFSHHIYILKNVDCTYTMKYKMLCGNKQENKIFVYLISLIHQKTNKKKNQPQNQNNIRNFIPLIKIYCNNIYYSGTSNFIYVELNVTYNNAAM